MIQLCEIGKKELLKRFDQEEYMKIWLDLVSKMEKEGFTWSSLLENDEWNQYMSPSLYVMPRDQWDRIIEATKQITLVLQKTWDILKNDYDQAVKLGIPGSAWDAAFREYPNSVFSYFCRYDLIVNGDQIKIVEVNSDTPTGLVEPAVANRIICQAHNAYHPNTIEEKLTRAWEMIKREYNIRPTDKIFYTAYDWHDEDRDTVHFNMKHCLNQSKEFVGVQRIIVADNGLFSPNHEEIRFLYRLYPLEFLEDDIDDNGRRIGWIFLDHIAKGRVMIINPPSAFVMQSKAVMAVIWDLYESRSNYFTSEEREIIGRYFLPTYFKPDRFIEKGIPYVAKPIWGREGGGVSIIDGDNVEEDRTEYYYRQRKVYQQYVEMPDQLIGTWDGDYRGKLLVGSHVIGGEPAGLFLRVGERITGNLSMFMGITVE